jgi:cell division protein FtsB
LRKSLLVLFIYLSIVAIIAGCSDQTNLNNKIQSLEDKNKELQMELDKINSLSMLFQYYEDKQRLVAKGISNLCSANSRFGKIAHN